MPAAVGKYLGFEAVLQAFLHQGEEQLSGMPALAVTALSDAKARRRRGFEAPQALDGTRRSWFHDITVTNI